MKQWLKQWKLRALYLSSLTLASWGFTEYKDLHSVAISGLPKEVWFYFKNNESKLVDLSVAADRRKHTDTTEAQRHYIDLDLPKDSSGILPQAICDSYNLLSYLFYNCDEVESDFIIKVASDLGHYLGDAHVPLHTTSNYNGQLTGQTGIHSLWETHVHELTKANKIPRNIRTRYIDDIRLFADSIISSSNELVELVLKKEVEVSTRIDSPSKWGYRTRGRTMELIPTQGFCLEYSDSLNGMVQQRFYESADAIASAWYSAWVDGGSPNLEHLINESTHESQGLLSELQELLSALRLKRQQKQDTLVP